MSFLRGLVGHVTYTKKKANALVRREEEGLWYEKKWVQGGSRQTMKNDPNKGSILYTTGTSTKKT